MTKPLTYLKKAGDPRIPDVDVGLIRRFTQAGLRALIDYYNVKYPDRGSIHQVAAWSVDKIGGKESLDDKVARLNLEDATSATLAIQSLRETNDVPLKIVLTFFMKDNPGSNLDDENGLHTIPILVTSDKLIILRDDYERTYDVLKKVAENLRVKFVKPLQQGAKKTSIQAVDGNCEGIAVGILKDLTSNDLLGIEFKEDDYIPLPKMLKYSQSETYISNNFSDLLDKEVKEDGTTLIKYVKKNTIYLNPDAHEKVATRVTSKIHTIQDVMESLERIDEDSLGVRILEAKKLRSSKVKLKE